MISAGKKMESAGAALTKGLTVPLVAGVTAVTTAAISWESAFAGVLKTNDEIVDSTGNVVYSYKDLEDGLRGLAKELPSSHQEIAAVAEAAGQLGIQTDNVVSFTKTMIDLGESTNMGAETAATTLARFANITQMSQKDFDRLGSVIVDLGNNFATTESEISEMGLRLAGAGKQIGMSEGEILGFAAALSSVGVEAEAGGSAFSKVMVQMQLAVEKGTGSFEELKEHAADQGVAWETLVLAIRDGGKSLKAVSKQMGFTSSDLKKMYKEADKSKTSLENFSDVAGMTSEEFSNMFKSDPSKAIMKFVEGLSKAEEQGTSAIKVLDDMDIKEVRLRDSLLRAANASGVFEGAVKSGNKAWSENTALTEEANKRYETTESKLKMLKNEAVDAAIELGGPFVDALRDGLKSAKPLIKGLGDLAKAFSDADPETQKMIMGIIAATAAAGPLLSITGKVTKGIGLLGKGFVDLSATLAGRSAVAQVTQQLTAGATATTGFTSALAGGTGTVASFGSAAGTAAGSTGLGAMVATLGPLGPAILGIVGVGGALAIGYGAWKLFGEEAWNSSERVKRWGVDVGAVTDETLIKLQTNTQSASGQFGLMADGFTANSDKMVENFTKIGDTIEQSLIKKVEGLDQLIKELPASINSSMVEMIEDEKKEAEKALEIVQQNSERISEIKKNASNNDRDLSVSEAKIIKDLAVDTTRAYVETLDVSAAEKKKILTAMTADVENATQEEAKLWIQSLGKQRAAATAHMAASRKEKEKYLEELGYNLDGEFAQKFLAAWDEINQTTVDGFDVQIKTIMDKYPELMNQVAVANGQLINSTDQMSQGFIQSNEQIMQRADYLTTQIARSAKENAEQLGWQAEEMGTSGKKAARMWNELVFDSKTGEVKSNVREVVTEALKDTKSWNEMKILIHDANLDSNAKKVIGEAAIANNWWDGMAFEDKTAILEDQFSITMFEALRSAGQWDELSLEQKTAFLYSNTPETMAQTMLELGLWQEFEPHLKELKADNFNVLSKIAASEGALNIYNQLTPEEKTLYVDNYEVLTKINASAEQIKAYDKLTPLQKRLLANKDDLENKVQSSTATWNAWTGIPDSVKSIFVSADVSGAWSAAAAIADVPNYSLKEIEVHTRYTASGDPYVQAKGGKQYATGTNYHLGGAAIVNDQKGPLFKELILPKGGVPFIAEGRDVLLPNLPRGSKVLNARKTKDLIPHYANGVGVPESSSLVRNLRNFVAQKETVIVKDNSTGLIQAINDLKNVILNQKNSDGPININLKLGPDEFKAYIDSISEAQGKEAALKMMF
ncbi:phage tail tape measure protein [Enterococcus sp. BWR-S5]|uniref:phage tail tape measure protein n=1 Tax=Enterococcus sp. BWR-S5 TaxID=2787714 RepID=UPI003FA5E619